MRIQLISAVAVALGLLGLVPLARAQGECGAGPGCCGKKVCTQVNEEKTVPRTEWSGVCEDFCKPPCCWFGCLFGGKDCCGKVCTRRILVIRVPKEKKCVPTCVPTYPCTQTCGTGCCTSEVVHVDSAPSGPAPSANRAGPGPGPGPGSNGPNAGPGPGASPGNPAFNPGYGPWAGSSGPTSGPGPNFGTPGR
jgi:hypothetical protein